MEVEDDQTDQAIASGKGAELQVHPNTLRYRLKRAEDLLDINLGEPAGRLLVEIQLAILRRSTT